MRITSARFFAGFCSVLAIALAPLSLYADTPSDQQAQLQAQLDQLNQEISANQAKLAGQQTQRATLENQVAILDSQIKEAQLEIKQRNLTIQQVRGQIAQTQAGIATLDTKVAAGEASLAQILREMAEIDNTPLAEQILNGTLGDAFKDMNDFDTLNKSLQNSFTTMAAQRSDLSARQQALEDQNQQESDLLQAQQAQAASLQNTENQKQTLITETKGQESLYQQIIANQQKNAAQIKQQLFALNGASHTASFGDMYTYAKEASALTGVEPAFILGILREESNLGQNIGTGNWKTDMNPNRDQPIFQQICSSLGLDPDAQKVSKKPWYGWGGAMGPAQFIPSTWQLYQDRITKASGQNPANPWDPRTAVFAAALLLKDNGGDTQTAAAERLAAQRYLAGWKNASNPAYAFYGNDVMGFTAEYQQDINVLNGS